MCVTAPTVSKWQDSKLLFGGGTQPRKRNKFVSPWLLSMSPSLPPFKIVPRVRRETNSLFLWW